MKLVGTQAPSPAKRPQAGRLRTRFSFPIIPKKQVFSDGIRGFLAG